MRPEAITDLRLLITVAVRALCDLPDAVSITVASTEGRAIFEIKVAPSDYPKVVGSKGRNIFALRTVAESVARKHRTGVYLHVLDPKERTDGR